MKNKRIGILGGTFNPFHRGHLELGLKVMAAYKLDRILYILSANPPHKKQLRIAPAEFRWKMLNAALKNHPNLIPCDLEMKRANYSWTFDTIAELKLKYPENSFYFISGSEGFLKIKTWKNYKDLLKSISFIVVLKENSDQQKVENLLKEEGIHLFKGTGNLFESPSVYIYSYDSDTLSISSTLIRNKIKLFENINDLLDPEVKKIMEEYKLYES
jgi:nicotinate-nucleotide adenylyltransferase